MKKLKRIDNIEVPEDRTTGEVLAERIRIEICGMVSKHPELDALDFCGVNTFLNHLEDQAVDDRTPWDPCPFLRPPMATEQAAVQCQWD